MSARTLIPVLAAIALAGVLLALGVGSVPVAPGEVWAALTGTGEGTAVRIVTELRLPRTLAGFIVGGLLALAGALMQVLLRNPLAEPYVLGISGGAAVGALTSILFGLGAFWMSANAFAGALGTMLLVFAVAHGRGGWTPTRLLLTGVVIAAGWGAVISFLLAVSPDRNLRGMLYWLMGDLAHADLPGFSALVLGVGLAAALAIARPLNLLGRGDLQARALGVAVGPLRIGVYVLASMLTAAAVTVGGSIGFVGLIVPHAVRLVAGPDHRLLLPASVLAGGTLLVLADTLARILIAPQQLPVGVLTAMIGVPIFLVLLHRGTRGRPA
ncbi:MAG: iron ABC transporter permease [Halofilum sp. (in: g-proteobacteria)]|nr:iron ABC transporter permease [Halofilum sp. (in: g-proteobacteria)]